MTWLAIAFALASALTTAFSTSIQHQAAGDAPDSAKGPVGLLVHLLRRPAWLVGQVLGILGFVFHGSAMQNGPLALVQPIVICGIVFAVPVRAALSRAWPGRSELAAVVLTAAALATFLIASDPQEGTRHDFGWSFALLVAGGVAVVVLGLFGASRVAHDTRRSFLLGAVSGILFGLVAVLLKTVTTQQSQGGWPSVFASWPVYALVCVGVSGVAVNQLAYRTARLSASMPVLNVVDGAVALAFGYVVFHEVPRHDPLAILIELVAIVGLGVGLWVLARYEAESVQLDDDLTPDAHEPEPSDQGPSGYGSRV